MPTKNSKRKSAKDGGSERAMVAAVLLLAVPVAALSVAFALAVLTVPVLAFS